jgi:hypothetical protein
LVALHELVQLGRLLHLLDFAVKKLPEVVGKSAFLKVEFYDHVCLLEFWLERVAEL